MRILKFIFTSLIILGVLGVATFFLGRELLLFMSLQRLKNSLRLMRRIEMKGEYNVECRSLGSVSTGEEGLFYLQLRFISDTEYVVEAVCGQFTLNPFEIERNQLLPFVKKEAGNSGVIWGFEPGGIVLHVLGRSGSVLVQDEQILSESLEGLEIEAGPVSACAGYGFSCCQEDLTQGKGDQLTGVTDCPKNCYSQCFPRPVVLSFNTQPFFEQNTRTTKIKSGQEVIFMFVISDTKMNDFSETALAEESNLLTELYDLFTTLRKAIRQENDGTGQAQLEIVIDFGDGQTEELEELQGNTRHVYTCNRQSCKFNAELKASKGSIESADNVLGKVKIEVSRK